MIASTTSAPGAVDFFICSSLRIVCIYHYNSYVISTALSFKAHSSHVLKSRYVS